jgi:hypothetical protein
MNDTTQPKLYPAWKQALADVVASQIQPGQTIDKQWLEQAFGIEPAQTVAQHEKNHHLFRHMFWRFRSELLEQHQLMLRPIAGVGYEVINPQQQTDVALKDRGREVAWALQKLTNELTHVRHEALTDDQRKQNADALAKVGQLAALAGRQIGINKAP